jgi:hypothetical protein
VSAFVMLAPVQEEYSPARPYIKLWIRVLTMGILDYARCRAKALDSTDDAMEFRIINEWVTSRSRRVAGFNWICEMCGLEADRWRKLITQRWETLNQEILIRQDLSRITYLSREMKDVPEVCPTGDKAMKDSPQKLAYDKKYESSPQQVKNREARNTARRELEKKGAVKKGQDVDHKVPLASGGSNKPSNWDVKSEKANRGWRRGKSGYSVS